MSSPRAIRHAVSEAVALEQQATRLAAVSGMSVDWCRGVITDAARAQSDRPTPMTVPEIVRLMIMAVVIDHCDIRPYPDLLSLGMPRWWVD